MKMKLALISVLLLLSCQLIAAAPQGKVFETPEKAAEALAQAFEAEDEKAFREILGPDLEKLAAPSESERKVEFNRLGKLFEEGWTLSTTQNDNRLVRLGYEGWAFPIPLVSDERGWHFDVKAGLEEISNRRVGRNELMAIETCRLVGKAQELYHQWQKEQMGKAKYASKFASAAGTQDGLYWESSEKEAQSPLAQLIADPEAFNISTDPGKSWFGYQFEIKEADESNFILLARPMDYPSSGVMSFWLDSSGKLYETDLGPDSEAALEGSKAPSESEGWHLVDEEI